MALVSAFYRVVPVADGCIAGFRLGRAAKASRTLPRAGVVLTGAAAQVVGIVGLLIDVAVQIAARVDELQVAELAQVAEFAIERPGRALVAILVEGRGESRDLVRTQSDATRGYRVRGEIAVRFHVLIVLLNEQVPILVELQQCR